MAHTDRSKVARFAIDTLVPYAHSRGVYHRAEVKMPAHWIVEVPGFTICLTERVLLLPDLPLQALIDIWTTGGKVFSTSWEPLHISTFKRGPWMDLIVDLAYQSH
jgi:hypothetical protein